VRVRLLGARVETAAVRPRHWLRLPAIRILRRDRPYWQERGWRRNGSDYSGAYQTAGGAFRGRAVDRGWGNLKFFISDPPDALRRSAHWVCFRPRWNGEFSVHMAAKPTDVSSGILTVERLLNQVLNGGK
jgi:hypothetical protein